MELNKDFYNHLPSTTCSKLDKHIIPELINRDWFMEFWNRYRHHVIKESNNIGSMISPGSILKDYINLKTKIDL